MTFLDTSSGIIYAMDYFVDKLFFFDKKVNKQYKVHLKFNHKHKVKEE